MWTSERVAADSGGQRHGEIWVGGEVFRSAAWEIPTRANERGVGVVIQRLGDLCDRACGTEPGPAGRFNARKTCYRGPGKTGVRCHNSADLPAAQCFARKIITASKNGQFP